MISSVKKVGQYFTPQLVANFMTQLVSKELPKTTRVLEPCAGQGVFLTELSKNGYKNIVAYEIDSTLKNESPVGITYQDFLSTNPNDKFDVIIGNPPYVRWKNILDEFKEEFRTGPYWREKVNGLGDLLYAFMFLCVDKLREGGELIFITPMFWTETLHARMIRKWLTEQGDIELIVTFNEMRIFKEVSSTIMIFKFVKKKRKLPVKIVHVHSKDELTEDILNSVTSLLHKLDEKNNYIEDGICEGYILPQFMNGNPWLMIPPHIKPMIERIEQSCIDFAPKVLVKNSEAEECSLSLLLEEEDLEQLGIAKQLCKVVKFARKSYFLPDIKSRQLSEFTDQESPKSIERYTRLGDVCDIGNGLVSGLDFAFNADSGEQYDASEQAKFIPVVKAKHLRKYSATGYTPYIFVNDVQTEEELRKNYPHIFSRLSKFKPELEQRYQYSGTIPWWHWVFLRNFDLIEGSNEKILVPCKERIDKKGYVRFSLTRGKAYATQDVTVIVKKQEFREDIRYLLGILNSDLILTWLKYKGLRRGGVLEFSERPLARIPIRLVDWENPSDVTIHDKIVSLADNIIVGTNQNENQKEIENLVKRLYCV